MKRWFILPVLLASSYAHSIEICWTNPSLNVDESALVDLSYVTLHWGTVNGSYDDWNPTDTLQTPTNFPGDRVCAQLELPIGVYYLAATATNADGDQSQWSNQVRREVASNIPNPPVLVAATCDGCTPTTTTLIVGLTGAAIRISWEPTEAERTQIEMYEYPALDGAIALASGDFSARDSWEWQANRAGLFYSRMRFCNMAECSEWQQSYDQGFLYYLKLAAPGGGGID